MNEFKFQLTTFALVALLAFGGYWAFTTLDRGVTYSKEESVSLALDGDTQTQPVVVNVIEETPDAVPNVTEEQSSSSTDLSAENQEILEELQDLIVDNIFMKEGSRGTRVGTVQKFLNVYNNTSSTVDNQYGPGTLGLVREFQEAEGLGADGLAGPATYEKMIEILKQG